MRRDKVWVKSSQSISNASQEIRQLLYGKGRNTYRILFTLLDDKETSTVRILHICYGSQQTIGEKSQGTNSPD